MSINSKQRRDLSKKRTKKKRNLRRRQLKLNTLRKKALNLKKKPTKITTINTTESTQCYMCSEEAMTVEHLPPKCIFPAKKDVPDGTNYRKELITVPACHIHNTEKSSDDEYFRNILVMNLPTNQIGKDQFSTKVMRGITRRPKLMKKMLKEHKKVYIKNQQTGKVEQTIAINVDMERFNSIISMMIRGLHYHHFGKKCFGEISIHSSFLLSTDQKKAQAINNDILHLAELAEEYFIDSEPFGMNPEVFFYKVKEEPERSAVIYKLNFYGDCAVTVFVTQDTLD